MKKHYSKKFILLAVLPALALPLFTACASTAAPAGSVGSSGSEKKNGFHNASFSLESEDVENIELTFNGMTFEAPSAWRVEEEDGDTVLYPSDDDTDFIRAYEGSADQEFDHQQELVNAMYDELMGERVDAGCFIESHDLNIGGHRGKWFRSDVNFISEDGQPVKGYEKDPAMDGYLRECVLFAADKQNYVLLEAIYPMGSATEDAFGRFYKSTHYH